MQLALREYAENRNKVKAYRAAYNCENMTLRTQRRRALEVFEHPLMRQAAQAIEATAIATVQEESKINAAWVLKRAALLADFNIEAFIVLTEDGQAYYDFSDATEDDWYCITEYTVDTIWRGAGRLSVDRVKLKTGCKLRALELVGKHVDVQAFREQLEVHGAVAVGHFDLNEYKQARREIIEHDDC